MTTAPGKKWVKAVQAASVGIFWDHENVRVPKEIKASAVMTKVREALEGMGHIIVQNLYYDSQKPTEKATDRVNLDLTGWHLVDCPTRNSKETLDKKLIVDVMEFAWEHTSRQIPCCIVLITSDGDYSYALAKIRNLGVKTIVFHGEATTTAGVLLDTCEIAMSWVHEVLRGDEDLFAAEEDDDDSTREAASAVSGGDENGDAEADEDRQRAATESDGSTARAPVPEEEEESTPRREKKTTPSEAALERSIGDALAGRHLVLLHSINECKKVVDGWAYDSPTAQKFHAKRGRIEPTVYSDVRLSAIRGGFVEFGRKYIATGDVVPMMPGQDFAGRFSTGCLLRLTRYGHLQLEDNPETAASELLRDHNNSNNSNTSSLSSASASPPPSGVSSGCVSAARPKPSRKTELCRHFARGQCPRGDKCPFAHGRSALSFPRPLVVPCRFWNGREGSCKRGVECPFAHNASSH